MGTLEQIREMKQKGYSDSEISRHMREQGVSPQKIKNSLDQVKIKSAVEGGDTMEQSDLPPQNTYEPNPQEEQNYYNPSPTQEQYSSGYDDQEYSPQPPAQEQYSSGYDDQNYYPQQDSQQSYSGTSTDTVMEISEQVFEEKIKNIRETTNQLKEFSTLTESKLSNFEERLKKMENIIDNLQIKILEKVGSYGQNLESIKKEMSMMQDSFSKTLPKLAKKKTSKKKTSKK